MFYIHVHVAQVTYYNLVLVSNLYSECNQNLQRLYLSVQLNQSPSLSDVVIQVFEKCNHNVSVHFSIFAVLMLNCSLVPTTESYVSFRQNDIAPLWNTLFLVAHGARDSLFEQNHLLSIQPSWFTRGLCRPCLSKPWVSVLVLPSGTRPEPRLAYWPLRVRKQCVCVVSRSEVKQLSVVWCCVLCNMKMICLWYFC